MKRLTILLFFIIILSVIMISCYNPTVVDCKHDDPLKIKVLEEKHPTCQESGLTQGIQCTACGTMTLPQIIVPTINCIESDWIIDKEPTVTECGLKHIECTMCGKIIKEEIIFNNQPSDNLEYALLNDGTYQVIGIGECADDIVVIPEEYNGVVVTSIGRFAFKKCTSIVGVYIPDSVIHIDSYAFEDCSSLRDIRLPNSEFTLGIGAFEDCDSLHFNEYLDSYYLGNEVNSCLVLMKLKDKNISTYAIPEDTRAIYYETADKVFNDCTMLESIYIPKSITSGLECMFYGCTSLLNIEVDEDNAYYKSIDGNLYTKDGKTLLQYAVAKTDKTFTVIEGVEYISVYAFQKSNYLESVSIPNTVQEIGDGAFWDCISLQSIVIPDSVRYVGTFAFSGCVSLVSADISDNISIIHGTFSYCSSLQSIKIPSSVTFISEGAFKECISLINIEVDDNNKHYKSIDGNLYTKDGKTLLQYAMGKKETSFIVPDTVTKIGDGAFWGAQSLENIVIPKSVKIIGNSAFCNCNLEVIYCEMDSKPDTWDEYWNLIDYWKNTWIPVVWGYTGK